MKRFILFVAILSLVLTACGGGGEPAGNEATSGPVSITLWHPEPASAEDNLVKLGERFNASQNEVKVDIAFQGNDMELALKLIAGMPSGNVPTIAYMSDPYTEAMIDSHQIVPIQQYVDRDKYDLSDFAPAAIAFFTVNDTLYAMPHGLAVPLMYYNKIPFREAGLDPEQPPKDLDEVRAASEKLVQRDAAGNITRYGFALDIHPWFLELTVAGAGELYVNNDNGRAGFATEVAFDNDAGRKLFQWWHDMVHDGLALNIGWDPNGANGLLAVGALNAVMVRSTSAALRYRHGRSREGGARRRPGRRTRPWHPRQSPRGLTRRVQPLPLDHEPPARGRARRRLEVHQVADGARAAGRMVRR